MQDNWASADTPSLLGVLPSTPMATTSELITFHITAFDPTILNSKVYAPHSRQILRVVTDSAAPGYTVWKDNSDRNIALVKWQEHPAIEMRNAVPRQNVGDWLLLSEDRR